MQISIAERLRPFCHVPGTSTLLPGQGYQIQIFPCLIRIYDLQKKIPTLLAQLELKFKGPVQQFTICNDLEKGSIVVSGKTLEGWMRYHLISAFQREGGIRLFVERSPAKGVAIYQEGRCYLLHAKEWLDFLGKGALFEPFKIPVCERLSLGNHKAQDWELIKRRFNLLEIFPLVHRLGQLIPSLPLENCEEGTLSLLRDCQQSFLSEKPEEGEKKWYYFLLGCLHSMLVPQLEDQDYQGLIEDATCASPNLSPLIILSEATRSIRKLFIQEAEEGLHILPYLLPSLASGRLLNVPLKKGGMISIEWTKKNIRRLILYITEDQELKINFRSGVRSYRLRRSQQERGERKDCRSSLFFEKECHYLLDNFQ